MANGIYNTLIQQGFTPQQINALMQLGVLNEEAEPISQEMEMAQQLRQREGPRGRFAGRSYTAAHPLEHLATGVDRVRGEMMAKEALERQRQNAQEKARLRAEFLRQMGGGAAPAAAPSMPGGGMTAASMFPMPRGGR